MTHHRRVYVYDYYAVRYGSQGVRLIMSRQIIWEMNALTTKIILMMIIMLMMIIIIIIIIILVFDCTL